MSLSLHSVERSLTIQKEKIFLLQIINAKSSTTINLICTIDSRLRKRGCVSERSMQYGWHVLQKSVYRGSRYSRRDVPASNSQKYEPKRELRGGGYIELTHRDCMCMRYPCAVTPFRPSPSTRPSLQRTRFCF